MRHAAPQPPSSALPPLKTLSQLSEAQLLAALQGLAALYCPLPAASIYGAAATAADGDFATAAASSTTGSKAALVAQQQQQQQQQVDSGYASEIDSEAGTLREQALALIRHDAFERGVAERWLTGLLARAEELPCLEDDEVRQRVLDQAAGVLESFVVAAAAAAADDDEPASADQNDYMRDFSFDVSVPHAQGAEKRAVSVRLNDGLAGMGSSDHEDVGLQSWGASILFSRLLCASPARFAFTRDDLGSASPRIIELGAGTGLVSLVLGRLCPQLGISDPTIIATDYHPAVLANLQANIAMNFSSQGDRPLTALLDWSAPNLEAPLDRSADVLFATDVVYAPEHATWLLDCATQLLAPGGVFWLMVTVRQNGRFAGIGDTVEAAFAVGGLPKNESGKTLKVFHSEILDKRSGIGRGDESAYRLYRIGWDGEAIPATH